MTLAQAIGILSMAQRVETLVDQILGRVVQQIGYPVRARFMRGALSKSKRGCLPWFTVCNAQIEVDTRHKHVALQANLVHRGGRQSDCQGDHTQEGRLRFAGVREGVLGAKLA